MGAVGTVGGLSQITVTLTGLAWSPEIASSSATVDVNCLPRALATWAARPGEPSVTATSIRTVSSGTVAVTWPPRPDAVVLSLSASITGSRTLGEEMTSA